MKLGDYLEEKGIAFQSFEHPPAYTAQEVAAEEHVSGNLVAKTVVVHADGEYALCALPACYKLDMDKVAKALNAKTVRLANEGEMAELFRTWRSAPSRPWVSSGICRPSSTATWPKMRRSSSRPARTDMPSA